VRYFLIFLNVLGWPFILEPPLLHSQSSHEQWTCLEDVRKVANQSDIKILYDQEAKQLARKIVLPDNETLRAHVNGRIDASVELVVDQDGVVQCVGFKQGHPMLSGAAVQAASQWRFRPYINNGKASPFRTTLKFLLVNHKFLVASLRKETAA
jgi:Gram-negative bacterial TonB protein C-terminal